MSNFKRYTMVIRRDSEGFATPALKVRQKGEVLKFDEIKDLLQTDVQQLNVAIALLNDMVKVWDTHGVIHKDSWYYERANAVIAQQATI